MRVLVCGGRNFADTGHVDLAARRAEYVFLMRKLSELLHPEPTEDERTWLPPADLVIVSGAARGADSAAVDWAVVNWVNFEEYPADWEKHGKRAGHLRNQQMLDTGIDKVIAFPGGRGTADMVNRARKAGVEVIEVQYP